MATRKYYNGVHYNVDEINQTVSLSFNFHKELLSFSKWKGYKKLGGSSIPDVLQTDNFKTQFNAFCHISRIKMPILKRKYVNAGTIIEPMVFDALRSMHPDVEIENYRAEDYEYDFFKGKDDILGGVPDGYIPSKKTVLEIKTSGEKKMSEWEKEVPPAYRKQAQLYASLMNVDKYAIVVTFLRDEEGDYDNPENYPIKKRNIRIYFFKVNPEEAKDDIQKIKEWYKEYTKKGISPKYNLTVDGDLVDYLKCKNEYEWQKLLNKWKLLGKADLDAQP